MSNPFTTTENVNAVIRVRRGPEVDRAGRVFDSGEIFFTTDKQRLFIGDGIKDVGTDGGILVSNKVWLVDSLNKLPSIEKYDLVYRTDLSGLYMYIGGDVLLLSNYILVGGEKLIVSEGYVLPPAEEYKLGGVMVRDGLTVDNGGRLSINYDPVTMEIENGMLKSKTSSTYTPNIPYGSYVTKGVVQVSNESGLNVTDGIIGINIDNQTIKLVKTPNGNQLKVDPSSFPIPIASNSTLGAVKIGNGLTASPTGVVDIVKASTTQLGGIIIGGGFSINPNNGELSVDATDLVDPTPLGSIMWFSASAAPVGYLECNGASVSKGTYNSLYLVIGERYGSVDEYHFNLPDLRGEFVRGWDHNKGVDSNRVFGSKQADEFKAHNHTISTRPSVESGGSENPPLDSSGGVVEYNSSTVGGTETRPRNIALLPCIKAEHTSVSHVSDLNFIPKPSLATNKNVLTFNGSTGTWVASALSSVSDDVFIQKPLSASNNQVLTYSSGTQKWVATTVPTNVSGGQSSGWYLCTTPGTINIANNVIPAGVTKVKVHMCGAGGGGINTNFGSKGNDGGNSSITINGITVVCQGGAGATMAGNSYAYRANGGSVLGGGYIPDAAGGSGINTTNSGNIIAATAGTLVVTPSSVSIGGSGGAQGDGGPSGSGNGKGGAKSTPFSQMSSSIPFLKIGGGDSGSGLYGVGGESNILFGSGGGGGGAYATFTLPISGATTYMNAIVVGAGGTGSGSGTTDGGRGFVYLEW